MAVAIEAMGLSLPYSSSTPAADPLKLAECKRAVEAIRILLEKDIKPKDIMTRKAFENAITVVRNYLIIILYVHETTFID
jgi:dihydroxy-acid dehydratase